jgi:hypothetical protein
MNQTSLFSSLPERWREIREFPRYQVSDWGRIKNSATGRIMSQYYNSRGFLMVGLAKNRGHHKKSVSVLVAEAYLSALSPAFNSIIHLDGDRTNNHYANLMWRPLWFARKYQRQFPVRLTRHHVPIIDMESHEKYEHTWDAAMRCGLLESHISLAMENGTYVWPTGQIFQYV